MKRVFPYPPVVVLFLILCQCSWLVSTKIADIKNRPRHFAGKEVTISGEVTETFSLVVVKYFTLKDDTGEITVVTDRPLPRAGERLTVKGVVREAFSIGSESVLVVVEEPDEAR
jgi:aspartyl/asparaginyl-tRNA synthetase